MSNEPDSKNNQTVFDDTTEIGIDLPAYTGKHPFNELESFDLEASTPEEEYTSYLPKVGLPEDRLEATQQEQPRERPPEPVTPDADGSGRFKELIEEIRDFESNLKPQQRLLITFALGSEKISFHPIRVTLRKSGALDFEGRNRHGQLQTYFTQINSLTFCLSAVDSSKSKIAYIPVEFVAR